MSGGAVAGFPENSEHSSTRPRWHGCCLRNPPARASREGRHMKEIKDDLERKRKAIEIAIETAKGQTRGDTERNEISKDPYGTASLTHDDEMVADVVARRRRELANIDRALRDL